MTVIENNPAGVATRRLRADGEKLLQHGGTKAGSTRTRRIARRAILELLERMQHGQLTIVEGAERRTFGTDAERSATIEVRDARAYWAILTEGGVGLGRGYIEGWWHSDDPTTVLRVIIPNLESINELRQRIANVRNPITDPIRRILPTRGRTGDKEDIGSHYDIGNEFFSLFLDETLSYSSAVFVDGDDDLQTASLHKYDRLLDKLGVDVGQNLLEIGTGWGGMAIRAASTRGCTVTTTTISEEQHLEAARRVADAGLSAVSVLENDWRDLEGTYDRIVSVEMIEAVDYRDYPEFFKTLERHLVPDGMIGIQAICVPGRRYEAAKRREDYIRRFVFPGGMLPSIDTIAATVSKHTRLQLIDVEDLSAHYAETLRRWRTSFDENIDRVLELGLDERFCRLWRFYLAYCEAGFDERQCTVNQFVLVGRDWRPDQLTLRPH